MGETVFVCRTNMTTTAPLFHGTAQFELSGSPVIVNGEDRFISFDFPIECPNCEELPAWIVKNGHETSIKGNPQKYKCQCCDGQFMAHTCRFWKEQVVTFISNLITSYYCESRTLESFAREYHVSTGQLSRLLDGFWITFLEEAVELELLEREWIGLPAAECQLIQSIWIDETFIKIQGKWWYLIVAVDKQGRVIHLQLADNRSEETIWSFWTVLMTKCPVIELIVSDGLPGYEKACKKMRRRVIHVQHIHEGDRKRVKATLHEYDSEKGIHHADQVGMKNNALLGEESKEIRYMEKSSKDSEVKRPRGRPKGRKDSTPRKKRTDQENTDNSSQVEGKKLAKKRGPKNVFKDGHRYVIDPFPDQQGFGIMPLDPPVTAVLGTNREQLIVLAILMTLMKEFSGKHITSNRIENKFSCFDAWQTTRGRRTPRTVDRDATLFFTRPYWSSRLPELINRMKYRMSTLACVKTFLNGFTFQSIHTTAFPVSSSSE